MDPLMITSIEAFLASVKGVDQDQATYRAGGVAEIGESWRRHGLRAGDIVLLMMPNSVELLWHWFGVLAAGAVPALVSPSTPSNQLREIRTRFSARAIVSVVSVAERSDAVESFTLNGAQAMIFEAAGSPAAEPGEVIILTSGTSGVASGCVFSLDTLLLNARRHADAIGLREGDSVLVTLPLYYSYALVAQVLAAWQRRARLVISGPPFHVPSYLALLTREQITVSSLTPVLVRKLLHHQQALPDSLRVLTVGGDMLAPQHVERLLALRPGQQLYLTYGLTEAGPRVLTLAAHQEPARRFASAGLPLVGTHVRLERGDEAASSPGELLVLSETVMKRRIGLVEGRSRSDWRAGGYLATSDIFEQDEEGYLYFRGRLSDFLVKDGEKVSLASVRRIATSIPGVVAARTQPVVEGGEKIGFDLTVSVGEALRMTEKELQISVKRSLRPAERPLHMNVVALEEGVAGPYK